MGLAAHVSDNERLAIVNDCAVGLPVKDVAAKYNRGEATISRIRKQLREAKAETGSDDVRAELIGRAYGCLKTALSPTKDVDQAIKAGPLAVQTLKGLGEFTSDNATGVTIAFMPNSLEWAQPKQVGSSSTPAAIEAEHAESNPAPASVSD